MQSDLTGMLTAIAADEDFQLAADKFRRSFAPGFVQTPPVQPGSPNREDEKTTEAELSVKELSWRSMDYRAPAPGRL